MITLDQVRALEERVGKAVSAIERLKAENASLREDAAHRESRITELETLLESFKRDQARIEEGIVSALERLDVFEDMLSGVSAETQPGRSGSVPSVGGTTPAKAQAAPNKPIVEAAQAGTSSGVVATAESHKSTADELGIF